MIPPDQAVIVASARHFASFYRDVLRDITQQFGMTELPGGKRQLLSMYKHYAGALKVADKNAVVWMRKNLSESFTRGDVFTQSSLNKIGFTDFTTTFTQVHREALANVIGTMRQKMLGTSSQFKGSLLNFVNRIQQSTPEQKAILQEIGRGVALGKTRAVVSAAIEKRLAARAVGGYIRAGSKHMRLDDYAELLARTNMHAAFSRGTETRLISNGIDLVQISEHGTLCEICRPEEGKIYSISGETTGYPPISMLPNEGTPFHPNCLHVEMPYILELETAEYA